MSARGQDTRERILDTAQTLVLEKGFSATSLDDIIRATGLTKGAFFHHFRSKGDLARQLVERFAAGDFELMEELRRRAEALAEDPYQALVLFIKLFEEWFDSLPEPFAGCLFAVYVYESQAFEAEVNEIVSRSFRRWEGYYEEMFAAVLAARRPRAEVSAGDLAQMMVSVLEGAFILARAYGEPGLIPRQSRMFRDYLRLLFEDVPARSAA